MEQVFKKEKQCLGKLLVLGKSKSSKIRSPKHEITLCLPTRIIHPAEPHGLLYNLKSRELPYRVTVRSKQDTGEAPAFMHILCVWAVCLRNIFNVFSVRVDVRMCRCVHYCTEQIDPRLLTNGILRGTAKIPREFHPLDVKIKLL